MEQPEPIQLAEEPVHEPIFGGYDFVFVDELSEGQTCSICLVAMRNPVQTACGHRFCEECLLRTFRQRNERVCPHDRNPIPHEGGFFPDLAWEREILSLRIKCKKSDTGCDWSGELRHYEEHFNLCSYEDVSCEDCNVEMQRRFLDEHMASECQNRIVQCAHCEEGFQFWLTEVHEGEECTRSPLECPQQCGVQEIPREDVQKLCELLPFIIGGFNNCRETKALKVDSHLRDDCPMTLLVCPYQEAGCTFNDKRINLKAHIEESTEDHLSKTWKELIKTKKEVSEIKKLEGQVVRLQSESKAMETSLQRNKEEISDLKLLEKTLEVENLSLKKEVTQLQRKLAEVQENTATEILSLKELVQDLQPQPIEERRADKKKAYDYRLPGRRKPILHTSSYKQINSSQRIAKIQGQDPLNTAVLAAASPGEQKQILGERLYRLIHASHPQLAGKLTGMLLEIDNVEILHMLKSREALDAKVQEALSVLRDHSRRHPDK